jgi:hypothetical protein
MQAWAMTRLARALSYARPFSLRERERGDAIQDQYEILIKRRRFYKDNY